MQSSNPYTSKHLKSARNWVASTVALVAVTLGAAVGVDAYLNRSNPSNVSTGTIGGTISGSTSTASSDQTVTGDAIQYRFGTVQLSVTRKSGKITDIGLVQAYATAGRDQAFPYLQQYAIKAQGTNFGNLSGATYTTDAFKQALDSAISKLS